MDFRHQPQIGAGRRLRSSLLPRRRKKGDVGKRKGSPRKREAPVDTGAEVANHGQVMANSWWIDPFAMDFCLYLNGDVPLVYQVSHVQWPFHRGKYE